MISCLFRNLFQAHPFCAHDKNTKLALHVLVSVLLSPASISTSWLWDIPYDFAILHHPLHYTTFRMILGGLVRKIVLHLQTHESPQPAPQRANHRLLLFCCVKVLSDFHDVHGMGGRPEAQAVIALFNHSICVFKGMYAIPADIIVVIGRITSEGSYAHIDVHR